MDFTDLRAPIPLASVKTDSSSIRACAAVLAVGGSYFATPLKVGSPRHLMCWTSDRYTRRVLERRSTMELCAAVSPCRNTVVYSLTQGGNTDIFTMDIGTGQFTRLTNTPRFDTAPSYSPDGSRNCCSKADALPGRSSFTFHGPRQARGDADLSFARGASNGTPVWSPRGDLVAFYKQNKGRSTWC